MFSRGSDGAIWMEDKEDEDSASWNRSNNNNNDSVIMEKKDEMGSLSAFKSMLDDDWFEGNNTISSHQDIRDMSFTANLGDHHQDNLLLSHHKHLVGSSSSCSPSSCLLNNLDPSQVQYLLQPKPSLSSILNFVSNNPLDHGFDLSENGFLENQATNGNTLLNRENTGGLVSFNDLSDGNQLDTANLCPQAQLSSSPVVQSPKNRVGFSGFQGFKENPGNAMLLNRYSKLLRPLEIFPSVDAQPTLFQKRAALRMNSADNGPNLGVLDGGNIDVLRGFEGDKGKKEMGEENEKIKSNNRDDVEDLSIDGSALNYGSDEFTVNTKVEEILKNSRNTINADCSLNGGDQNGKNKGLPALPAKNLMAERRRRKKLNDKLYMLRSVVPKISKMDRASILGDAIDYLKELLQKINDLHNELESTPPSSSLTPTTSSFHPLTPTPAILPSRIKDELCPSLLPSLNEQTTRVEVRLGEGKAVNIHMFCERRPGLLLSIMRVLDNLGLDVHQAVISSFNGFSIDIFRAEVCKEGQVINPEHIKAILLDSVGLHNLI